jgi:hypothetical protein
MTAPLRDSLLKAAETGASTMLITEFGRKKKQQREVPSNTSNANGIMETAPSKLPIEKRDSSTVPAVRLAPKTTLSLDTRKRDTKTVRVCTAAMLW